MLGVFSWSKTEGLITKSFVREKRVRELRKEWGESRREYRDINYYVPDISYKYSVDGRQYTSNRIGGGSHASEIQTAVSILVDTHPTGSEVAVFYDPDDPSKAVLVKPIPWLHIAVCGASVIPVILGAIACTQIFRGKASSISEALGFDPTRE